MITTSNYITLKYKNIFPTEDDISQLNNWLDRNGIALECVLDKRYNGPECTWMLTFLDRRRDEAE